MRRPQRSPLLFVCLLVLATNFAQSQPNEHVVDDTTSSATSSQATFCSQPDLESNSDKFESIFKQLLPLAPLNTPKTRKQFRNQVKSLISKHNITNPDDFFKLLIAAEMIVLDYRDGKLTSDVFLMLSNDTANSAASYACQTITALAASPQKMTLAYALEALEQDYLDPRLPALNRIFKQYSDAINTSHVRVTTIESRVKAKAKHLTLAELMAVRGYTGSDYLFLNAALRGGTHPPREQVAPYIDLIISALKKLPPYKGLVVRGAALPPEVAQQHKPGNIVTYPAFTSASRGDVIFPGDSFRIQSKTGHSIEDISSAPDEREVLFLPGTRFKILSAEHENEQASADMHPDMNHPNQYIMTEVP